MNGPGNLLKFCRSPPIAFVIAHETETSMKFSEAFKVFQLNILRQAGIQVTPDQLGLKRDPIADLQLKNSSSTFNSILGRVGGNPATMEAPAPPTPPADPLDPVAQSQYQQELLAYQQSLQAYNQRFMQMMLQQFNMLQRSLQAQQKQNSSSSASERPIGTGGILGGFDV